MPRLTDKNLKEEIARSGKNRYNSQTAPRPFQDRIEKERCGVMGMATEGSDRPRTMIDSTRDLLLGRRERLIDEITRVEKALQLIEGDQRVQELNSIVAGLDL